MPSSIVLNGTTGIANATWTTATRPASPVAGQSGYNTTIGAMETYTGSTWSTSDLPAPSTAGNVLTSNGTSWTSQTPATPNVSGGATITSSAVDITLTSSSNRVQNVAMTASGKAVILPDATTLSAGGPTFIITNNGAYSFLVKNASGAGLSIVTPAQTLILGLASIATSDGKWVTSAVNTSSINISASGEAQIGQFDTVTTVSSNAMSTSTGFVMPESYYTSGPSPSYGSTSQLITLSSTSALFVYTRTNNNVYAVVITLSGTTLSVGTEVLVYTGTTTAPYIVYSIGLSSTAAFVNVVRTGSTILTYPLVIAGSTITVGTASAAWGYNSQGDILAGVAMDSTTALISNYGNAALTNYYVRTLIHNGTSAPTIGTPTILTGISGSMTYNGMCKLTSTTAFYYYSEAAVARVITISGSSAPTLGTSITIPASFNIPVYRWTIFPVAHSSTEVVLQNYYSTTYVALTISGTTVTVLAGPAGMPVSSVGCLFYYDSSTILSLSIGSSLQRLKYSGAGTSGASLSTVAQTPPLNYYYYGNATYSGMVCGCVLDGTYALRGMYNSSVYPQVYLIKLL